MDPRITSIAQRFAELSREHEVRGGSFVPCVKRSFARRFKFTVDGGHGTLRLWPCGGGIIRQRGGKNNACG